MRFRLPFAVSVLALSSAGAQTGPSAVAATALRATHVGALPPLMSPAMTGRRLDGAQLALRYGLRDDAGARGHALAASAILSAGLQSSVALTAGVLDLDCANCSPKMMLGLGGDMRVYERGDVATSGSALSLSVSGDLGWAQLPGSGSAIALGVGAPVAFSTAAGGRDGMRVVAFVNPVFGIGQTDPCSGTSLSCSENGTRWVLGGGLGLWNPMTNVAASVGLNHVVHPGGQPVYGVAVMFGGR